MLLLFIQFNGKEFAYKKKLTINKNPCLIGFNYSLPAGENEGSVLPFSEIVGLVRSGEE
jgi:hypothetical protein